MAIDPDLIKRLGGSKKVAAGLGITPNGLWRYTRPGADIAPKRQRQLIALAEAAGVPLDFSDFHRGVADNPSAAALIAKKKRKVRERQATAARAVNARHAKRGKSLKSEALT